MDISAQLGALAHPDRLGIFRLLMRRYPGAVPAGDVARALDLRQNTCSGHLKTLSAAGLIRAQRAGTTIRYGVDMPGASALMQDLFDGCCNARPDLCLPNPPLPVEPNVLFLCTGNAARSLMAEALLRDVPGFRVRSGGTDPAPAPHPQALATLAGHGIDAAGLRPKAPTEADADIVITLCDHAANEACQTVSGMPLRAHWSLPDPKGGDAAAFQDTFHQLRARIDALTALPLAALDRLSLQDALDDIGRMPLSQRPPTV
ncbi:MAG: metalloregulator ArsR/SmtB family transcription factor [Pseudomonadota bacterium]